MRTAVVILNWNTKDYLRRWLPPLLEGCRAQVYVADNASTDGSLQMLSEEFPAVRTIPLERNFGFTGGYNRAIDAVRNDGFEFVVLLNSDIEAPAGWLEPLEEWMDSHPQCGVCGPKILAMRPDFSRSSRFEYAGAAGGLMDRYGYPFCRGRVLGRTEEDSGQYDSLPSSVLWVSGACLMTRASLWKDLGGLDARFFAHMEEIDYCWRAQKQGWKVDVVYGSAVWHLGAGTLAKDSPFKLKLNYRNNLLLMDGKFPRHRVRARMALDALSAALYLCSGRVGAFKAVLQAHREYRALTGKAERQVDGFTPDGLLDICLLPKAFIKGKGIFKYLRKYENSH